MEQNNLFSKKTNELNSLANNEEKRIIDQERLTSLLNTLKDRLKEGNARLAQKESAVELLCNKVNSLSEEKRRLEETRLKFNTDIVRLRTGYSTLPLGLTLPASEIAALTAQANQIHLSPSKNLTHIDSVQKSSQSSQPTKFSVDSPVIKKKSKEKKKEVSTTDKKKITIYEEEGASSSGSSSADDRASDISSRASPVRTYEVDLKGKKKKIVKKVKNVDTDERSSKRKGEEKTDKNSKYVHKKRHKNYEIPGEVTTSKNLKSIENYNKHVDENESMKEIKTPEVKYIPNPYGVLGPVPFGPYVMPGVFPYGGYGWPNFYGMYGGGGVVPGRFGAPPPPLLFLHMDLVVVLVLVVGMVVVLVK